MKHSKYHIKNIWLVKGDGSEPVKQEILISSDGKILACGGSFTGCGEVIDGRKKLLAPGFIDAHGHSDLSVLAYPDAFSKVSQGVTTEIAGNCGLSAFPVTGKNLEHLEELYADYQVPIDWNDWKSYRQYQQKRSCLPDVIPLCGHNTLRASVAGYDKTDLSGEQKRQMLETLDATVKAGCPGLSAGLLYVPGKFASDGEIIDLMKCLTGNNKVYATHLRSEGKELLESLENTLQCALDAGLKKVQISHFKTAGKENWTKLDAAFDLIRRYRRAGVEVTIDRYPYVESMTQLSVILPGKWADMTDSQIRKELQNAEECRMLRQQLEQVMTPESWARIRLASTGAAKYRNCCGKMLTEISDSPAQLTVELLASDANGTCGAFAGMSEENLRRILMLDICMPGSDGYALPLDGSPSRAHPRSFGTVPRFLRMLLDMNVSIGETVRRATGLPASVFGLTDRGVIEENKLADLTLFDPDELEDTADFSDPHSPARGIEFVIRGGNFIYRRSR